MPTFDRVATRAGAGGLWRVSRQRKLMLGAALAAAALSAAAWLARPAAVVVAAAPQKLDARILPAATASADEARIAAFQEAVALSFVRPLAAATAEADRRASAAASPAHPRGRAAPTVAKRDVPAPPPRPAAPAAIAAAAPPAADPGDAGGSLRAIGEAARRLALAPVAARDFAAAAIGRAGGTLSAARARIGF